MRLGARLRRLERQAPPPPHTYRAGDGEDPPCPPWFNPAEWAARMRISRCSGDRVTGALRHDEYLPGMGEEERRYVDGLSQVFDEFLRTHRGPPEEGPL